MNQIKGKVSGRGIIWSLGLVCVLLFVLTIVFLKSSLNSYRNFTEMQLVAIVECKQDLETKSGILEVELFKNNRISLGKIMVPFAADEWVIEGRIVKWKNFFTLLGFKPYYHLERVTGRYTKLEKEKIAPRIVYALSNNPDRLWPFIYKFQKVIPIIDAAYGNSVFVPFEPGKKFRVYVVYSGFMLRDVSEPRKRSWWEVG